MLYQPLASLQGQIPLIVDAVLLLFVLVSGMDLPPKLRLWSFALYGLCWCAITVAAIAETAPLSILR